MREEIIVCDVCGCSIPKKSKLIIDFSKPIKDQINPMSLYSIRLRSDDIRRLLGDICEKCLHIIDAEIFSYKEKLLQESKCKEM